MQVFPDASRFFFKGLKVCGFIGSEAVVYVLQPCHDRCVGKLYLVVVVVQGAPRTKTRVRNVYVDAVHVILSSVNASPSSRCVTQWLLSRIFLSVLWIIVVFNVFKGCLISN
jgi:hypothetical protein